MHHRDWLRNSHIDYNADTPGSHIGEDENNPASNGQCMTQDMANYFTPGPLLSKAYCSRVRPSRSTGRGQAMFMR